MRRLAAPRFPRVFDPAWVARRFAALHPSYGEAELLQHLDPGEDSVGTRVDIQHLAATPEGMEVEITARITAVDRRAVTFEAVVRDAYDEVGRCTHHRFVVEVNKLKGRLEEKAAKARGSKPG